MIKMGHQNKVHTILSPFMSKVLYIAADTEKSEPNKEKAYFRVFQKCLITTCCLIVLL